MKYKTLMGLSTLALASFIFSAEASAETKQSTTEIVQPKVETGGVKQATVKQMTATQSAKQLKKVKALSALPTASSKAELADAISKEMRAFNETINIEYDGTLTMDEIREALHGANKDTYVYGTRSAGTYGYSLKSGKFVVTIKMTYNHTKAQEAELTTAVKNITKEIIQPSMSDVEKIKAVNDYVVTHTTYSKTGTKTTPHSPYTIISEGKGVCQAYALLTYRLLEEAGIENMYVTGYAGEAHAWNLVKVDGEWYHLDTTWNDPTYTGKYKDASMQTYVRYDYFLISDKTIFEDHTIDAGNPTTATDDYVQGLSKTKAPILNVSNTVGKKFLTSQTIYVDGIWYAVNSDGLLVKIEHNNMTVLSKISDSVGGLKYADGKLYYQNYSYKYTYDLTTKEEKIVSTAGIYTLNALVLKLNEAYPYLNTLTGTERKAMSEVYNKGYKLWSSGSTSENAIKEMIESLNMYLPQAQQIDTNEDNSNNHQNDEENTLETENIYKDEFGKLLSEAQQQDNRVHVEDENIQNIYDSMIQQGESIYNRATQADVDSLKKQLQDTFETYFVNGHTKTALQYQSDVAYGLYTATGGERFEALVSARAAADVVLDDKNATTEQIEQAIYQLKQVIFNAKSKFDKTALLALIEQARAAGNLEDVVSQAQAVVEQDDASKTQIQAVTDLLEKALKKTDIPEEEKQIIDRAAVEIFICRYPDFGKLAGNLLEQLSKYSDEQKKQLPTETLEKIEQVQVMHTKMETFEASLTDKQAWAATPKKTTNALKPWTISLSTSVAHTVQNAKYIKVYDMFGEEIEVEVSLNGKKITVTPQQQYEPEMMYTLSIDKNLTSQSGKKLKKDLYVQFQFEQ